MRPFIGLASALAIFAAPPVLAQATAPAPAAPAPAATAAGHYSTTDTDIGTLLDDPAARAVLARNLPELVANDQIAMARSMTLRSIQSYAADTVTDAKLTTIDRELAALPAHP